MNRFELFCFNKTEESKIYFANKSFFQQNLDLIDRSYKYSNMHKAKNIYFHLIKKKKKKNMTQGRR